MLRIGGGLVVALTLVFSAWQYSHVCEGFVEDNDMQIPVRVGTMMVTTGIDQATYNKILDRIELIYKGPVKSRGSTLKINRLWEDDTVNAFAQRSFGTWSVSFPGGLPRHPAVTADGFALVACHEIGHHLGGFPAKNILGTPGMSIEGQADYFANSKCLREYFTPETNIEFFANNEVDERVIEKCQTQFQDENDVMSCARGAVAGMSVSALFKDLREEDKLPDYFVPDSNKVVETITKHPGTQCRLDTYFSASRCVQDKSVQFGLEEENTGACTEKQGYTDGFRPRCWFKPGA
jgi:hypothetical protein